MSKQAHMETYWPVEQYAKFRFTVPDFVLDLVEKRVGDVANVRNIIDVGCGPGHNTAKVAIRVFQLQPIVNTCS